jgi:uncharacterized protein (TIGR03083 family)
MNRPFVATEHIWTDGTQIIDAGQRAGLDAAVPSCPGWAMRDLLFHIGECWSFWAWIVSERVVDVDRIRAEPEIVAPTDDFLIDWVTASHVAVHAALTSTPLDTEVWTWTGANRDVDWVRRRMAHETAIHRWDAELVTGDPYDIPTAVAADGIDEFLTWFLPRGDGSPLGGSVHLHCTDTHGPAHDGSDDASRAGGEWVVRDGESGGYLVERVHAKGDAAVRGTANDLVLWLWGRDGGPVEILGDATVADRLRTLGDRS